MEIKELYTAEPTILAIQQKYTAVNKIIESDQEELKAGTVVTMTDLNEPIKVATGAEDAGGVLLHTTKLKDGKASVAVLIRAIINKDKLDEVPAQEVQDALKDIQFISRGKGGKR